MSYPRATVYRPSPIPQPPSSRGLRGQFCILGDYPYGPHPSSSSNPFFMNELDTVWLDDPHEAERILRDYLALGANHITAGPAIARSYKNQYPHTDYRGHADRLADYLEWVTARVPHLSYWVLTDNAPWYDSHARTFNWPLIEQDFTPIYQHPRIQRVLKRVVYMWEDFQHSSEMVKGYDYLRRVFPHALHFWHNPPGHLSPGLGSEEDRKLWDLAAAHGIHGLYMQASPPGSHTARPPYEQMKYDLWDMHRRFTGTEHSPWGGPILSEFGTPLEVVYAEGVAYAMYHNGAQQSVARQWGQGALSVTGVIHSLDGLP